MNRITSHVDKTPEHKEGQIISTSTLKMNKSSRMDGSHQLAKAAQTTKRGLEFVLLRKVALRGILSQLLPPIYRLLEILMSQILGMLRGVLIAEP